MRDDPEVLAAKAEVDRLAGQPGAPPAECAHAALRLSRALAAADRTVEARAAAEAGIRGFRAAFLTEAPREAELMRGLVAQYVALAQQGRVAPDAGLLAPIAVALGDVMAAEDRADEGDGG